MLNSWNANFDFEIVLSSIRSPKNGGINSFKSMNSLKSLIFREYADFVEIALFYFIGSMWQNFIYRVLKPWTKFFIKFNIAPSSTFYVQNILHFSFFSVYFSNQDLLLHLFFHESFCSVFSYHVQKIEVIEQYFYFIEENKFSIVMFLMLRTLSRKNLSFTQDLLLFFCDKIF